MVRSLFIFISPSQLQTTKQIKIILNQKTGTKILSQDFIPLESESSRNYHNNVNERSRSTSQNSYYERHNDIRNTKNNNINNAGRRDKDKNVRYNSNDREFNHKKPQRRSQEVDQDINDYRNHVIMHPTSSSAASVEERYRTRSRSRSPTQHQYPFNGDRFEDYDSRDYSTNRPKNSIFKRLEPNSRHSPSRRQSPPRRRHSPIVFDTREEQFHRNNRDFNREMIHDPSLLRIPSDTEIQPAQKFPYNEALNIIVRRTDSVERKVHNSNVKILDAIRKLENEQILLFSHINGLKKTVESYFKEIIKLESLVLTYSQNIEILKESING